MFTFSVQIPKNPKFRYPVPGLTFCSKNSKKLQNSVDPGRFFSVFQQKFSSKLYWQNFNTNITKTILMRGYSKGKKTATPLKISLKTAKLPENLPKTALNFSQMFPKNCASQVQMNIFSKNRKTAPK